MKIWRIINFIWLIIFVIGVIFILLRKVDGTGVTQTPQIRMVSLGILGIFLVLIILCQWLSYTIIKRRQK
ncbi:DUF3923 family protein [Companilactobacillus musae]|uniref:DUF3923 family protein n=1 Tax=Companilactobacillus musae TaxID=1903258 RepID=UPI000E65699C|nr:DUF3923 family protein [Companilactobacillus musae]